MWKWSVTHIVAVGVVELLLAPVLQHLLHHSAPAPHVKHGLPVLVAHLLSTQCETRAVDQTEQAFLHGNAATLANIITRDALIQTLLLSTSLLLCLFTPTHGGKRRRGKKKKESSDSNIWSHLVVCAYVCSDALINKWHDMIAKWTDFKTRSSPLQLYFIQGNHFI